MNPISSLAVVLVLLFCQESFAETLESFLVNQALGRSGLSTYHDEVKALLLSKDMVIPMDKKKIGGMLNAQRGMSDSIQTTTDVVEFKILGKTETEDAVSVVSKIKLSTVSRVPGKEASKPKVFEVVSHDILLKRGDGFVSIFSVTRDDGSMAQLASSFQRPKK